MVDRVEQRVLDLPGVREVEFAGQPEEARVVATSRMDLTELRHLQVQRNPRDGRKARKDPAIYEELTVRTRNSCTSNDAENQAWQGSRLGTVLCTARADDAARRRLA